MTAYSVLIPAHDEASVIARTLASLRGLPDAVSVLVVCNGCRDDTAARARCALPTATIAELEVSGKAGAINHGLDRLPPGPVIIMDADVEATPAVLDALIAALAEPGVRVVSPVATIDMDGADGWVRAYYRVFQQHYYLTLGIGGSGIYGLSGAGRYELGRLPQVMSDDDYVRHFFPLAAQRRVGVDSAGNAVRVTIRPPRRLCELVRSEARWRAGDAVIRTGTAYGEHRLVGRIQTSTKHLAWLHRHDDVGWSDIGRYLLIKLAGRAAQATNRVRGRADVWHRDTSSRAPGIGAE